MIEEAFYFARFVVFCSQIIEGNADLVNPCVDKFLGRIKIKQGPVGDDCQIMAPGANSFQEFGIVLPEKRLAAGNGTKHGPEFLYNRAVIGEFLA
ncbi:hypothetical protein LDC_2817 [sediment metagenome]|uniref:Uncharacterized protein n=1 Tax=sediment metagenome TaxID=749907 RepID=D9PMN9_9ZZZZ